MQVILETLIQRMKDTRYNVKFGYNKDTGEIKDKSDISSRDGSDYLDIPEMDENGLMEDFANGLDVREKDALLKALVGKGNFKRFRDKANELGLLEYWNRYRDFAYEDLAKEWCDENYITVVDEGVRPYIICHMVTSIDGKVTGEFLNKEDCSEAENFYYELHRNAKVDGFACGRITMEGSFTKGYYPDLKAYEGKRVVRNDYVADDFAPFYAVSFDRKGSLGWKDAYIMDDDPGYDNAHIIEVLTERVSDAYLAYLRDMGISYIIAGEKELDLKLALAKLYRSFGIRRLLLEGGSTLNAAFLKEDCVDELSLVTAPLLEGKGKPLFENSDNVTFVLENHRRMGDTTVYGRYTKKSA